MKKQTKSRKSGKIGKGNVTPVQIAFIVDRYLADNNFNNTRSSFRIEASNLLSRSPVQEAPKSLLSLGELIDEYIVLKGQKVILDQEKGCLKQEQFRIQNLLSGMQNVMNAYNNIGTNAAAAAAVARPVPVNSVAVVPHVNATTRSPAGLPVYNTPSVMPECRPFSTPTASRNQSTPNTHPLNLKRKSNSDASFTAKKSRSHAHKNLLQVKDTSRQQRSNLSNFSQQESAAVVSPDLCRHGASSVQGSSVAKCLFNQPSHLPPTNSSNPNTPPQAMSAPTDILASPQETANPTHSNNVSPQPLTSTASTMIASETFTVSPSKQITCSVERNYRISSSPIKTDVKRVNTRDHAKGRLDFDEPNMTLSTEKPIYWEVPAPETGNEVDCLDFEFPNFDSLGPDFNFSELLVELGIDGEELNCSYQPVIDNSSGSLSGSQNTPEDAISGANQVVSEFSSTVTEVLSEKDMNLPGPDTVTSMKSITKRIQISSPAKKKRSSSKDQENVCSRNQLF